MELPQTQFHALMLGRSLRGRKEVEKPHPSPQNRGEQRRGTNPAPPLVNKPDANAKAKAAMYPLPGGLRASLILQSSHLGDATHVEPRSSNRRDDR